MNLGNLKIVGQRGNLPLLRGRLVSMVIETDIVIYSDGELTKKGKPIYRVGLKTPSGKAFVGGTAYCNRISQGENAGCDMWNIRIAAQPGIPHEISLAAWPEDGEDDAYYLSNGDAKPKSPGGANSGGADESDSIPF